MSLKAFHIFFISISILIGLILAVWCGMRFHAGQGNVYLYSSIASVCACIALFIYARRFLKKLKHISYL
ncbi:MAG: hypothetical protein EXS24_04635 [Pedosphaera sp.]|nr:hypothetical protein [Pedosphaera sp.]